MSNFFKSPFYFLFCVSFGFLAWSISFQSELNDPMYFEKNKIMESNFSSLDSEQKTPQVDDDGTAISFDDFGNALPNTAIMNELNAIKDSDLLKKLELSEEEWQRKSDEPFVTNPFEVEQYEKNMSLSYGSPKDLSDFTQIAAEPPQIQLEDEKACGVSRLAVDNVLKKSPAVAELIKDRADDPALPKKCLIHVMRQFNLPDSTRGRCVKGSAGPLARGAAKPCVSKALVNATYNSYVDVSNCLGLNLKSLLPKLSNESGMLINTLGGGLDAGVGQLTASAIEEVNRFHDSFMQEIETNAAIKPSCARILKYKSILGKISKEPAQRCSLMAPPENPIRNILYMAMLNRINTKTAVRRFQNDDIPSKFVKLGMPDANMNALAEGISLVIYNSGPVIPVNALNKYLDKRAAIGKKITAADFDFYSSVMAKDIDGEEKNIFKIARSYVNSPFMKINDPNNIMKLKKVKLLSEKMRTAHLLTFPEYLIYSQNNFYTSELGSLENELLAKNLRKSIALITVSINEKKKSKKLSEVPELEKKLSFATKELQALIYKTIGAPGYLGFLADKNRALRESFAETSEGADYCSNPNFLKIK